METNIAGYVRVSDQKLKTDGERRQDIERQKNKIKKFSESMGWGEPIFFSDDGISAFKDDYSQRPNFVKLLNEIRANRIKRVIIEDLTRWSRRVEDGLKTMREASEKCTVTSMAEGEVDSTLPEGWFKTAVSFLLAEWSSRSTSYKVASGMDKLRNNKDKICESCGIVHLGRHPFTCECKSCRKKRVGKKDRGEYEPKGGAFEG
jgi:DNA invertase Pin-like site-specific DNA recombinase